MLNSPKAGALVFYGKKKVTHIALAISKNRILEAGGGGRRVISFERARSAGAKVRENDYNYRNDIKAIIMPNYRSFHARIN